MSDQARVTAHMSALIWFSISSDEVFHALKCGHYEDLRNRMGMDVDERAFWDLSNLLNEKAQFELGIRVVRDLWRLRCSPPPCSMDVRSYSDLFRGIVESLGFPESK
jgi:hypothetical protein